MCIRDRFSIFVSICSSFLSFLDNNIPHLLVAVEGSPTTPLPPCVLSTARECLACSPAERDEATFRDSDRSLRSCHRADKAYRLHRRSAVPGCSRTST